MVNKEGTHLNFELERFDGDLGQISEEFELQHAAKDCFPSVDLGRVCAAVGDPLMSVCSEYSLLCPKIFWIMHM